MKRVTIISSLLFALSFAVPAYGIAPPPADSEPRVIQLYDAIDARADRTAEEFAMDDETCPNEARLLPIVIPVTRGEQLVGYAFATPRFCLSRGVNRFQYDDQWHFIVDRMVREAHRTPFELTDDESLDKDGTISAILGGTLDLMGQNRVERLDLLGSDVLYLR